MKIAFWVNNRNIRDIDTTRVDQGNPGIGGTEFSAILIAQKLRQFSDINTIILCPSKGIYPRGVDSFVCDDLFKASKYCIKNDVDFFVLDSRAIKEDLLCCFPTVKYIAWGNCFAEDWMFDVFCSYNNLMKFVCVGKSQFQLMRGTSLDGKVVYIYNSVPRPTYLYQEKLIPNNKRANNVVYIGSLHKEKGFHILARAWKNVIKEVPDAKLYIIGSGKLYARNAKVGNWGLASKEYEDMFIPYITDNGNIMESVHFLGIMGEEKYEVLAHCKVGVPNPSGESETFGYTAVEMQLMGCQVTTIKCPAYLDTVCIKSNLYTNVDELANNIIDLLRNNSYNFDKTAEFLQNFSIDAVLSEWYKLFQKLNFTSFSPSKKRFKCIFFILNYKYRKMKRIIRKMMKK